MRLLRTLDQAVWNFLSRHAADCGGTWWKGWCSCWQTRGQAYWDERCRAGLHSVSWRGGPGMCRCLKRVTGWM